jgi:hypothetical protein
MTASRELADSEYIGPLLAKIDFNDEQRLESLSSDDSWRLRQYYVSRMIDLDNEYYQYQNGMLDQEFFEGQFKRSVIRNARRWRILGITELRADFTDVVDELLAESTTD